MKPSSFCLFGAALAALAACSPSQPEPAALTDGDWTLDPAASDLSYVSIKAGEIAETNTFETLAGGISADGAARIEIDLASVDTGIDIRTERVRDILFDVASHPTATVTAQIDPRAFASLGVGETATQTVAGSLDLKGIDAPFEADVAVTRVGPDRVLAVATRPVIVEAADYGLVDGLAELQQLAGLPSIAPVVPVTFSLSFER